MKAFCLALALFASGALAQPVPVLHFEPPKGFTGGAGGDPATHVSKERDATVSVLPFKPHAGELGETFRASLLRELLPEDRREQKVAGGPEVAPIEVPGADEALFAKFIEDRAGTMRYRLRVAIRSGAAVAIVDYDTSGPKAYMGHWPALATSLERMRVRLRKPAPKK